MADPDNDDKGSGKRKAEIEKEISQRLRFVWKRRIEFLSGLVMLAGLILSFFYIHIGGLLVGFAFGLCFFDEIYTSFLQLRDFYSEQGIFKTLMWIGVILYFLIAIPGFIIATAIGFGAMFFIKRTFKK